MLNLQLIDDQGEQWDGASRQLRVAYDSPYSGGEFSDYAVANLGFVALNIYGNSAQVRLRPSFVSDRAFDTLYRILLQRRFARVVLSCLTDDWHNEMVSGTTGVLTRLDEIIEHAQRHTPDEFVSRPADPRLIRQYPLLADVYTNWCQRRLLPDRDSVVTIVDTLLGNRFVLLRHNEDNARLTYKELGSGLFVNYETWRTCAVGAPMEEMPDRKYGRWATVAYREALDRNEIRIEDVDAIVRWPHSGRTRMRYRRFIIPLVGPTGERMVVGGSLMDGNIDLRLSRPQKA